LNYSSTSSKGNKKKGGSFISLTGLVELFERRNKAAIEYREEGEEQFAGEIEGFRLRRGKGTSKEHSGDGATRGFLKN